MNAANVPDPGPADLVHAPAIRELARDFEADLAQVETTAADIRAALEAAPGGHPSIPALLEARLVVAETVELVRQLRDQARAGLERLEALDRTGKDN